MQTIGERLEEARKRKGISIREAAEHTKIRGDYLQKFEANSFDIDLPPLYIRGFIRTYSRYLELDPERLVSEVDALLARDGKPSRREHREALGRVDFGATETRPAETAAATTSGGRAARDQAMMIKFGLIGGGAIVAIIVIILLINVLFTKTPAKPAPAVEPAPTATAEAFPSQTLTLTALDTTRVKIVQDLEEVPLFNGTIARGETKSFKKQGLLIITVEDRTKVRMEVNGKLINIPTFPAAQGNYGQFRLD